LRPHGRQRTEVPPEILDKLRDKAEEIEEAGGHSYSTFQTTNPHFEEAARHILKGFEDEFGIDIETEDFADTPRRFAKYLREIIAGAKFTTEQIEHHAVGFPSQGYDEMVLARNVWAVGLCPHHLAPIEYRISVGYIPGNGKVLGLSKLVRMARVLAGRPILQEHISKDIVDILMKEPIEAKGAGCVVKGRHGCMVYRGVKSPDVDVTTSSVEGVFRSELGARAEFLELIKGD
jgi:GTP cyclohydrolase I